MKFTILPIFRYTIQWPGTHSQCCATVTSITFQNISVTPEWKYHTRKLSLPIPSLPQPLATKTVLSVSLPLLGVS